MQIPETETKRVNYNDDIYVSMFIIGLLHDPGMPCAKCNYFFKTGNFCRMALVGRWAVENNCFSRVMNFKYIISSVKTLLVLFSQFPLLI